MMATAGAGARGQLTETRGGEGHLASYTACLRVKRVQGSCCPSQTYLGIHQQAAASSAYQVALRRRGHGT